MNPDREIEIVIGMKTLNQDSPNAIDNLKRHFAQLVDSTSTGDGKGNSPTFFMTSEAKRDAAGKQIGTTIHVEVNFPVSEETKEETKTDA